MKYILSIFITLVFTGCGGGTSVGNNSNKSKIEVSAALQNNVQEEKKEKYLTVYIHGYAKDGHKKEGVFGESEHDSELDQIVEISGYSTLEDYDKENFEHIVAMTEYYGDSMPSYYSAQDIKEVTNIEEGIPKYALIVSKFIRHTMDITGANRVNIVSASMGSLVTRYLIEYNFEDLSGFKEIDSWLSLEGVIRGNVAASDKALYELVNKTKQGNIDIDKMKYSWVNSKLSSQSPYYNDIRIGFESSTKDNLSHSALSYWLRVKGKYSPNDGTQLVKDTMFTGDKFTHTYFHENHLSIKNNRAAWAFATTFLFSKKRVKITLLDSDIDNLHEKSYWFYKNPAEIVFGSSVYSMAAESQFSFDGAIDTRSFSGRNLPLFKYKKRGSKTLNQILFDSYILNSEDTLTLSLTPYEIDLESDYGVYEPSKHNKESLGKESVDLPLQNGIYEIGSHEWSARVKLEIL